MTAPFGSPVRMEVRKDGLYQCRWQLFPHFWEWWVIRLQINRTFGIAISMEGDQLKPSIGFIGVGHMGSHMAQRLLDAGYQVTVYDRTKEKAQEVGQRGAQVAQTARDLAADCQIVMACVTDDRAQKEVMFGPDGALAGVHGGSIMIDLSTVSPDASRRLFQAAKEKNVPMIDAACIWQCTTGG